MYRTCVPDDGKIQSQPEISEKGKAFNNQASPTTQGEFSFLYMQTFIVEISNKVSILATITYDN
jgi:hypothetical protein